MSKYTHMTLTDRYLIERCINNGYSLKEIAVFINRHPSTVSREIRNHRTFVKGKSSKCVLFATCYERKICANSYCMNPCKSCRTNICTEICGKFTPFNCPRLSKSPYVCNNCSNQEFCKYEHAYYHAYKADAAYRTELSESRKGVHADEEQLLKINDLITPLIKKGQSLNHIYSEHSVELDCSRKTMYNYIDRSLFTVRNIDLPRKVRYKRRKQKPSDPVDYQYRKGRTYEDFRKYITDNPDIGIVEMDTVKGRREKGKVMLTMVFVKYDFMLIFLLDENKQDYVTSIFRRLLKTLGTNAFKRIFPVILTDNGSEFKNPIALETTEEGLPLTKIFYCDPNAPYQKPHIERQHEIIRRIIPKSVSLDDYNQEDMTLLTNHLNSFSRKSLDGFCPFAVAKDFLGTRLLRLLNLKRIQSDDVILNPSLLKK